MSDHVRVSVDDRVATIVLDRPAKRNAINLAMWRALAKAAAEVRASGARVLIVRGGEDFSAGADISEFATLRMGPAAADHAEAVHAGAAALATLEIPTIAAITGVCIGGGCEVALACDIRLAAVDARFGITPAKLGIVYHADSTRRLVNAVGPAWAKRILYSADIFDAATALRIGLVDELHPASDVPVRVAELAGRIAGRAQVSVRAATFIVDRIMAGGDLAGPEVTARYAEALDSPEYAEGVAAFMAGRAPRF